MFQPREVGSFSQVWDLDVSVSVCGHICGSMQCICSVFAGHVLRGLRVQYTRVVHCDDGLWNNRPYI